MRYLNEFEPLVSAKKGQLELTQKQKEKLWRENVTGSRIRKILDPKTRQHELLVARQEAEPSFNISSFDSEERANERMMFGTIFEAPIIEAWLQQAYGANPKELKKMRERVVIDKRTFASTLYPFKTHARAKYANVSANIDGFIITEAGYKLWKAGKITDEQRIYHVDRIIEIKNTTQSRESLVNYYEEQTQFYSWFFNAKQAPILIYLKNGNELGVIDDIVFDDSFDSVLVAIEDFIDRIRCKLDYPPYIEADDLEIKVVGKLDEMGLDEKIPAYRALDQQIKDLKVELELLKKDIETTLSEELDGNFKTVVVDDENWDVRVTSVKGRVTKDWQALVEENRLMFTSAKLSAQTDSVDLEKYFVLNTNPTEKIGSPSLRLTVKESNNEFKETKATSAKKAKATIKSEKTISESEVESVEPAPKKTKKITKKAEVKEQTIQTNILDSSEYDF